MSRINRKVSRYPVTTITRHDVLETNVFTNMLLIDARNFIQHSVEPPSKLAKTNIAEQDKDSGTNSDEKTSMESTGENNVTNEEPKGENDVTHEDAGAVVAHEDAEAEAVVLKEEIKEDSVQPKQETEAPEEAAPGVNPSVLPADPSSIPETPEGPASFPRGLPPGLPGSDEASPVNPPSYVNEDANPDAIIEEKGEVSSLYIGRVIGKGGEMIRDLQARSGARIDVDQSVPPGMPRVITYRGTRKTVDFAKRLVHMLCQENVNEADLPLGEAKREYLIVPASSVGKIIGRGGEMIRELQNRSHAKIQVDHSGSNGMGSNEKRVTVTGTEQAVVKAKEMVLFLVANPVMDAMQSLNMLIEDKVQRGGVWGSGPPYTNLPQNGHNMQPGPAGYGYDQSYYGGTPAGAAAGHGAPSASYGAPAQGTPYAAPAAHSYQQPPSSFGGGVESEVFLAPRNYMGRIIGSKGVTINDLQRRSACDIQINQDLPPGRDCEITIRGTRQGIEMAKQMLREIIEVGPSHPYAGGTGGGQCECSLSVCFVSLFVLFSDLSNFCLQHTEDFLNKADMEWSTKDTAVIRTKGMGVEGTTSKDTASQHTANRGVMRRHSNIRQQDSIQVHLKLHMVLLQ